MNRKRTLPIAAILLVLGLLAAFMAQGVLATAEAVHHEKSTNTITGEESGIYTKPYFSTSGGHGTTPWSTDIVTVRFKVNYQSLTDHVFLYYTTDGSDPLGAMGTTGGSTTPVSCTYEGTFADGGNTVAVAACTIPPEVAGTTVKYILGADDYKSWTEVFANNESPAGAATVFSYQTLTATAITLRSFQAVGVAAALPVAGALVAVLGLSCAAVIWRRRG